jgi:hypothetical protein
MQTAAELAGKKKVPQPSAGNAAGVK